MTLTGFAEKSTSRLRPFAQRRAILGLIGLALGGIVPLATAQAATGPAASSAAAPGQGHRVRNIGLYLEAEGGCGCDRRSCSAGRTEGLGVARTCCDRRDAGSASRFTGAAGKLGSASKVATDYRPGEVSANSHSFTAGGKNTECWLESAELC